MQAVNFDEELEKILQKDPRYRAEAYHFLREALDFTQHQIGKPKKDEIRHVSGQQLLDGIRQYALQQYGPMALMLLNEWGVHRGEDFGEIVFNMVESRLLAKTDKDSREDFKGGYDFDEAFRLPFKASCRVPVPEPKPTQA
jgi:uncharacterized repeat protein (TIGR04138 family)